MTKSKKPLHFAGMQGQYLQYRPQLPANATTSKRVAKLMSELPYCTNDADTIDVWEQIIDLLIAAFERKLKTKTIN